MHLKTSFAKCSLGPNECVKNMYSNSALLITISSFLWDSHREFNSTIQEVNKNKTKAHTLHTQYAIHVLNNIQCVQAGKLALARSPMRVKIWLGEWKTGLGKWNFVKAI